MTEREALKLTLAALKQIDEAMPFPVAKLAIMEAEKALAQQCVCGEPNSAGTHRTDGPCLAPQPEQEPVAFDVKCDACEGNGLDWDDNNYKCVACSGLGFVQKLLYTTPPTQCKPLTLGQKQRLWSSLGHKPTLKDRVNAYGRAIEEAHGIKENT